jgi:hypothetical protein
MHGTSSNGKTGVGFISVYLEVADDAASLPSGWSQRVDLSLTLVSRTDKKHNVKKAPESYTFKAGKVMGHTQFLSSPP